jgi:hypothetical protein
VETGGAAEKEAELIFRGQQYAHAIGLFQKKFANAFPPNFDVLVEQRFLRKKFKDPITNDDFLPLPGAQAPPRRGQAHLAPRRPVRPPEGSAAVNHLAADRGRPSPASPRRRKAAADPRPSLAARFAACPTSARRARAEARRRASAA